MSLDLVSFLDSIQLFLRPELVLCRRGDINRRNFNGTFLILRKL